MTRNKILTGIVLGGLAIAGIAAFVMHETPLTRSELPEDAKIEHSVLFPSNDRIMSNYCTAGVPSRQTCHLAAWDLDGGNVRVYATPEGHIWRTVNFSPDGKEFVFELNDTGRYSNKLAIMDLATERWRIIEGSDTFKNFPSYHPNGKKIIYAHVAETPDTYSTTTHVKFEKVDIHSLDLTTGVTTALTDYQFRAVSPPYYTGRGEEFVFSGADPWKVLSAGFDSAEYNRLYRGNSIITMNEIDKGWRPDFVMYDKPSVYPRPYAIEPVPASQGAVLYFESNKGKVGKYKNSPLSTAIWARENNVNRRLMNYSDVTGLESNYSTFSLSSDEKFFLVYSHSKNTASQEYEKGL
jgi:WD40 repeat protein